MVFLGFELPKQEHMFQEKSVIRFSIRTMPEASQILLSAHIEHKKPHR